MKLKSFGERFGDVAHSAVIKWEKYGDNSTNMNWACEKDVRLSIINELRPRSLRTAYVNLEKVAPSKISKITIDTDDILAA